VDNRELFRSSLIRPAIAGLLELVDDLTFFVADRLHLYNEATEIAGPAEYLALISRHSPYVEERSKWLTHLMAEIAPISRISWRVISVDDVADCRFGIILRNLIIAFYTIDSFRIDVGACAVAHLTRNQGDMIPETANRLSESYVLEEIALNLRLHIIDGIANEFYVGEYLDPLLKLYAGRYGIAPECFTETRVSIGTQSFYKLAEPTRMLGEWTRIPLE
jgi:hypothetical protein